MGHTAQVSGVHICPSSFNQRCDSVHGPAPSPSAHATSRSGASGMKMDENLNAYPNIAAVYSGVKPCASLAITSSLW